MKKHVFVLSAALFALSALSGCGGVEAPSTPGFSDASEGTRIMPIESSVSESVSESTGEAPEQSEEASVPEYPVKNEARCIETISRYDHGELINTEVDTLDEYGNVIKESTKWGEYHYAYEYNADGTVRVKYSEDGSEEYEYENGLEVRCTEYDENGKQQSVKTREYDEYGNETALIWDMGGGAELRFDYGYELDENGAWIVQYGYDADGEVDMYAECVRDEKGNVLSGSFDDGHSLYAYEYKYDERGEEVDYRETVSRGEDGVSYERHIVTEYDESGRISRRSEYRADDGGERLVERSEYEYIQ